jgi:hypothetical protein
MSEISPIENRYMGLMRGLDSFSRDKFDVEIIDHDYAPDHDPELQPYYSLIDYRRELDKLYGEIPDDARSAEAMRRNIESTDLVIDTIPGSVVPGGSSNMAFPDYVERAMSVRPEMVPEKHLRKQKREVAKAAGRLGYRYMPKDREAFNNEHAIPAEQMGNKILELAGVSRNDLVAAASNQALEDIEEPRIEPVNEEGTWQGFFGTDNKKLVIQINKNPLIKNSGLGVRAALLHERAHALSAGVSKLRVATGELSPAMGFLLCSSPMYFQEEVIARAAEEYMLAAQEDGFAKYLYKSVEYENDVGNNMILMANTGYGEEEVIEYGLSHLPYEEPDKIKQDVQMYTKKLVYKTVFAIDSKAIELGREIAAMPDEQRYGVIGKLCQKPLGVNELVSTIKLPQ